MEPETILSFLRAIFQPGDVFELRILDAERPQYRKPHIESGYFDYSHLDAVPKSLATLANYRGAYITPNPVKPALLSRAANRIKPAMRNETTSDHDIAERRWLLLDIDPDRPAGIASTDAEHAAALAFGQALVASLPWPAPILLDSGNGCQALYRLPSGADDDLSARTLKALAPMADGTCHIDQAVHNPARIWRLPGTWNRKGDSLPDRPHRLATIISLPPVIEPAPVAAWLAAQAPPVAATAPQSPPPAGDRPGDAYNARGDLAGLLERHGWQPDGAPDNSGNQRWRRPGKKDGTSATWNGQCFYVFSSNAPPFRANTGYSPFECLTLLEHGGDHHAAAQALLRDGYGERQVLPAVNLGAIMAPPEPEPVEPPAPETPGIPARLLRCPGFIGELMDHTMASAPYPSQVLAFAGALAMQGFLCARKLRDAGDNRPNLYLLALGESGCGKDHPRKINVGLLRQVGLLHCLGDTFASAEGLQDAMAHTPAMLYQTDEIDTLIQAVAKGKDARYEAIMGALLTYYSSANSSVPMRRKAGNSAGQPIDQPHLGIMGSAVPGPFWQALNARMLANGLVARMLILEAGPRGPANAAIDDGAATTIPTRLIETAAYWRDLQAGGNLGSINPQPMVASQQDGARAVFREARAWVDAEYQTAYKAGDSAGCTILARAMELARKLALIYAASEAPITPVVTVAAAKWACELACTHAVWVLAQIKARTSDDEFDRACKAVVATIKHYQSQHSGCPMPARPLRRKHRQSPRDWDQIVGALVAMGAIEVSMAPMGDGGGRPTQVFRAL